MICLSLLYFFYYISCCIVVIITIFCIFFRLCSLASVPLTADVSLILPTPFSTLLWLVLNGVQINLNIINISLRESKSVLKSLGNHFRNVEIFD